MKTQADKTALNKSKAVANTSFDKEDKIESEVHFKDNRPEVVAQRKLRAMADNSPQVSKVAQLQAIANGSSPEPVQKQAAEEEEMLQGKFEALQKQEEEEELLQGKFETIQKQELEDEELLQGKFETIQKQSLEEEEEPLQGKCEAIQKQGAEEEEIQAKNTTVQQKEDNPANNTGLPDTLKSGIENLSGLSLDDVKVHYNSPKPAQLQAHAFAQGTDIHMAPGQEKYLPHEAWHVVQQKQGRVKPTRQMKGKVNVNDDAGLEKEADVMGEKAFQSRQNVLSQQVGHEPDRGGTIQIMTANTGYKTSQNVIQRTWTQAEVTKKSGAAVHKYKENEEGEVSVKKGGWFGGGKLLTVPEGDLLWVDPDRKVDEYVLGMHPLKAKKRSKGYINENNIKTLQWSKDVNLARSLLDGYLNTHKVQQHIEEKEEFQESTRKGMGGLFAAINKNRDKGAKGFFDEGRIKDPMKDVEHWKDMGSKLKVKPDNDEEGLIPMTCDQSTAIIISTLADNPDFISSLTVIKQGDPKQHGHWYVLANRSPEVGPPVYGEALNPGEFIIDIWGSLRLKEDDEGVNTVVHTNGANAVFNAAVITKDQKKKGAAYVKKKMAEQNKLQVMLSVAQKND